MSLIQERRLALCAIALFVWLRLQVRFPQLFLNLCLCSLRVGRKALLVIFVAENQIFAIHFVPRVVRMLRLQFEVRHHQILV